MDAPERHYAEWTSPDTERQIPQGVADMWNPKKERKRKERKVG